MKKLDDFNVILLGVIYDPERKEILIGRRENDPFIPNLTWSFPGGRLNQGEGVEDALKKRIKEKTNIDVESLGTIFSRISPEKKDFLIVYFLCEKKRGKEKALEEFKELKWVKPEEVKRYFETSFHPHMKEYILNLR